MNIDPMELASKTCYAIAYALSNVPGVTLAITAFPGETIFRSNKQQIGDTVFPILKPKELLHQKFAMNSNGGTPMAPAIWYALTQLHLQNQFRKIIFIITDGEPDSREATKQDMKAAQNQGVEVYGLGINTESMLDLLPGNSAIIPDITHLPNTLFSLLQKTLLKANG